MSDAFDRSLAFLHSLAGRLARRRVPFRFGTALFDDELPLVWDLNYLSVERPGAEAAQLASEADRLEGDAGHGHRKVVVWNPLEGRRLRPGFEAFGWEDESYLVMVQRREPDRVADSSAVREVSEQELQPVRERGIRAEPWATDDEVVRQVLAHHFLLDAATDVRRFAVLVGGEPVSHCDLYSDGRTAQIESVMTVEEHRNRGHARAVVLRAMKEARSGGCDHLFLVADPADWPKELYRKLGFDEVGLHQRFHLTPRVLVERLRESTAASRVTLRVNAPGDAFFPVKWEALAEGVKSIKDGAGIDLRGQPVARVLEETGEQVVQDDCARAFDDPEFHRMREAYGGLAAQIVTPLVRDGRLAGILSLHQCGEPRVWTSEEITLARETAERLTSLIRA